MGTGQKHYVHKMALLISFTFTALADRTEWQEDDSEQGSDLVRELKRDWGPTYSILS